MQQDALIEIVGVAAAILILVGYFLISTQRVDSRSPIYQWLNVSGAVGFIVNGYAHRAYPIVGLNVIWVGIGFVTLLKVYSKRSSAVK